MPDETVDTSDPTTESGRQLQAADTFDLRRIIGGLFAIYGVILVVVGLTDGPKQFQQAAGVHINLLAGLGMLVLSAFFIAWALLRPLSRQLAGDEAAPPPQ